MHVCISQYETIVFLFTNLLNYLDHLDHLDIDMEINGFHTDAPPAAWTDYHTCLDQNALCLGQLEPRLG